MYIDNRLSVSRQQVVTANAASTDTIDLSHSASVGPGQSLWLVAIVRAVSGTTPTLQINLQDDTTSAFGAAATIAASPVVTSPIVGQQIVLAMARANRRHLRANYTVGGTSPSFTLDTFLTDQEPPTWTAFRDAI